MITSPNYFVIGAARSATTALCQLLRQHPQAFVTDPKEPNFLAFRGQSVRFRGPGDENLNSLAITEDAEYNRLYEHAGRYAVRGEGSVSTLYYYERSLANLDRFPFAQFIVLLREPGDRAFSSYRYQRLRGFENIEDFEEALDLEPSRIKDNWQHIWHYTKMSLYAQSLKAFIDEFGKKRVLILFYDDFAADPSGTSRRAFDFLGIDSEVVLDADRRLNSSRGPRSQLVDKSVRLLLGRPVVRNTVRTFVPYRLRERILESNLKKPTMPPIVRARLDEAFAEDLTNLRSLLDLHYPEMSEQTPRWLRGI